MEKKIVKLTEGELRNIIAESVLQVMNEIDAKTYSHVHNATAHAKSENQNGYYIHTINPTKSETNDSIIAHGIELEPHAADSMISPYKNVRYMFYCKNLRQNVGITLFNLQELYELTSEKSVLKGEIIFNNHSMNGSIIIDMGTGTSIYYHNSSKKKYPLEIDNRFASQWNKLVQTLQEASKLIYIQ